MVITGLQHLRQGNCGIKIRGLWNRGTILQSIQFVTLAREGKTRFRTMASQDKCGSADQGGQGKQYKGDFS